MDGFERITGREHEELVEKCQENGWLKVGGFDWQDDPFLEEYPYEFSRTESVDRLREALGSGNWAIRQGFCYRDLAFIQQVNGGDEWWTLKRDGDAWTGFESWSFGAIAQEPERFERAMRDMCEATPEWIGYTILDSSMRYPRKAGCHGGPEAPAALHGGVQAADCRPLQQRQAGA